MRKFLAWSLVLMVVSIAAFAQEPEKKYNFSNVDVKKANPTAIEKQINSLKVELLKDQRIDSLQRLLDLINKQTYGYEGIRLGVNFPKLKLDKINQELTQNQFSPLSENRPEFEFAFVGKTKHWLHELSVDGLIDASSTRDNTKVSFTESSVGFNLGYAVVDTRFVTLYPFVGFFGQFASLSVRQDQSVPASTSLFTTSAARSTTKIVKNEFDGTAGGELDLALLPPGYHRPGIILAARYAGALRLIDGRYKVSGKHIEYFPDWEGRRTYWGLSIKLVGY